jgi:hypothetical protein
MVFYSELGVLKGISGIVIRQNIFLWPDSPMPLRRQPFGRVDTLNALSVFDGKQ